MFEALKNSYRKFLNRIFLLIRRAQRIKKLDKLCLKSKMKCYKSLAQDAHRI